MKIAVVVSTFPPYHGGMGNAAFSTAVGLARLGHAVEVFCPAMPKAGTPRPVPFAVHRLKPWARFGNSAFLPQLVSRLGGFDLINLHYPFYGGAEVVGLWKAAGRKRPPLVLSYQMDNFGRGLRGWALGFHARRVRPAIFRAADRVIALTYDYLEHSAGREDYRRTPSKFAAVPLPVDTARFAPRAKDPGILGRLGLAGSDKVVLFVGGMDRPHAFKGVGFLLDAWRRLGAAGTKLVLVGQGDLRQTYIDRAAALGLTERAVFADPVENEDLPQMYDLADLVVLPSLDRSEAFGLVLLEAMASGRPVIASDLPGVRSVFKDGREGSLFPAGDEQAFLDKLRGLLADAGLRARMGAAGRDRAVSDYAQEVVWRRLERVFLEVLR